MTSSNPKTAGKSQPWTLKAKALANRSHKEKRLATRRRFKSRVDHELSRGAMGLSKGKARTNRVTLPERSTRPMQRTLLPWQLGQRS